GTRRRSFQRLDRLLHRIILDDFERSPYFVRNAAEIAEKIIESARAAQHLERREGREGRGCNCRFSQRRNSLLQLVEIFLIRGWNGGWIIADSFIQFVGHVTPALGD